MKTLRTDIDKESDDRFKAKLNVVLAHAPPSSRSLLVQLLRRVLRVGLPRALLMIMVLFCTRVSLLMLATYGMGGPFSIYHWLVLVVWHLVYNMRSIVGSVDCA